MQPPRPRGQRSGGGRRCGGSSAATNESPGTSLLEPPVVADWQEDRVTAERGVDREVVLLGLGDLELQDVTAVGVERDLGEREERAAVLLDREGDRARGAALGLRDPVVERDPAA